MAVHNDTLSARVARATGQNPFRCYQCGKCSAGCPMAGRGDVLAHQVFRLLQIGHDEEALGALQPWLCVSCQTCATRCPQDLDLSMVMDFLRAEAVRLGTAPPDARRLVAFNQEFMKCVSASGRLSEGELGARYNLRTMQPFNNLGALPGMLLRGKLRPPGRKVKGAVEAVRRAKAKRADGRGS